jgi:hypothetical protein
VQEYHLLLVDVDKGMDARTVPPASCDKLGFVDFRLSDIVTQKSKSLTLGLQSGTKKGQKSSVLIHLEELSGAREVLTIQLAAKGLRNVEMMSKSDPFIEISKKTEGGTWVPCFKSETRNNDLNPVWSPFTIKGTQLNNGDPHRPLLLRVYDYEANGAHQLLGEVETSAMALSELSKSGSPTIPLVNGPSSSKKKYTTGDFGEIVVRSFQVEVQYSFLDYISSGAELGFIVAVDFTASNGDPRDPRSLHYLQGRTAYEDAICGVGRVLDAYDHDSLYQVYAFGVQPSGHPKPPVQHCLEIGHDVAGIPGILSSYRQALNSFSLSGPTLFAPLLNTAIAIASTPPSLNCVKYSVLLILTDGEIMDMKPTVDAIVAASNLPLSILIVGVGNSPGLANMTVLDADHGALTDSRGRRAARDIVQFVKFSDHQNNGEKLASELLAELPGQFLQWARAFKIAPPTVTPGIPISASDVVPGFPSHK